MFQKYIFYPNKIYFFLSHFGHTHDDKLTLSSFLSRFSTCYMSERERSGVFSK